MTLDDDGLIHQSATVQTGQPNKLNAIINKASKAKTKKWLITCGWCGKHHPSYKCQAKTAKAWIEHICRKCGGKGPPAAVCPSYRARPTIKINRRDGAIFTTFLVNGPFGESICRMPMKKIKRRTLLTLAQLFR